VRACSSCSHADGHADWCPRLDLDYDPNPAMTDAEVKALGYSHRDETGRWVKAPVRGRSRRSDRAREFAERRCLTCGVPDDRHFEWCWRGDELENTVGAALRDSRDLQAAIAWQPKRDPKLNPKVTGPERAQLNKLFAALVARRRERETERPPRKLWSIREWRENVARREGRA
jgi:hypothetical protein